VAPVSSKRNRPTLDAPAGLVATRLDLGPDAFALLEWPIPRSAAPLSLSSAEREVLELVMEGLSNAEIASRRERSPRTVANQIASIFRRLGVHSRSELLATLALRGGDG
jgi:DNA-binding CsgD family transcriptional regulator